LGKFSLPRERPWELVVKDDKIKRLTVNEEGEVQYLDPFVWECIRCGQKAVTPTPEAPPFCPHCNKRDIFKPRFPTELKSLFGSRWHVPWQLPREPKEVDTKWLYRDLKECISKHLVLTKETQYDILTKWVMATWRVDDWITVPYLLARGEIESGKTRLLEVLSQVGYRVIPTVGISPAVLRKQIEWFRCTCAIDQAEDQLNRKFEPGQELYRIVLAGYKRGMYVARCREGDPTKIDYDDPFGFKALASTRSFDPAVDSRCIILDMEEAVPEFKDIDLEWCNRLRAQLLFWRLRGDLDLTDAVDTDLSGRTRELFMPLLTLSRVVGGLDEVETFAEEHRIRRRTELSSQFNAAVVEALVDLSATLDEDPRVYVSDIKEAFVNRGMEGKGLSTRIGIALKNLGFKKGRSRKRGVCVDMSLEENVKKLGYWQRKYEIK